MLATSFRSSYIFFCVLAASFLIFANDLVSFEKMRATALKIETLNAIIRPDQGVARAADRLDIINLTEKGSRSFRDLEPEFPFHVSDDNFRDLKIFESLLLNARTVEFQLYGHPRASCKVLYFDYPVSEPIFDVTPTLLGNKLLFAGKANITAFNATDCAIGYQGKLAGFILSSEEEEYLYIDDEYLADFESMFLPEVYFGEREAANVSQILSQSPYLVTRYFDFPQKAAVVPTSALKTEMVSFISSSSGIKFKTTDLDSAINHLYSIQLGRASVAGLSARTEQIILFAPIIFLAASWLMFRAATDANKNSQNDLWLASDVDDIPGKLAAVLFASFPFLLSVSCSIFFCAAFQIKGVGFGYVWRIDELYRFEIIEAPPRGWIDGNSVTEIMMSLLWWPISLLNLIVYRASLSVSEKCVRAKIEQANEH